MNKYKKVLIVDKRCVRSIRTYSPEYDKSTDELCVCGHQYYRHFDSYEKLPYVSCKYCNCMEFIPYSEYYHVDKIKELNDLVLSLGNERFNHFYELRGLAEILQIISEHSFGQYTLTDEEMAIVRDFMKHNEVKKDIIPISTNKFRRGRIINMRLNSQKGESQ